MATVKGTEPDSHAWHIIKRKGINRDKLRLDVCICGLYASPSLGGRKGLDGYGRRVAKLVSLAELQLLPFFKVSGQTCPRFDATADGYWKTSFARSSGLARCEGGGIGIHSRVLSPGQDVLLEL